MDTPMITLEHIVKSFSGRDAAVHAVRDVSLTIERGSIYGIVGFSGAGKSTLVRCINLLERPTSGRVFVDGTELTALHGRALNEQRKKIGMIFQQFNLFATRTVFENVAFPLRYTGLSGQQIREKVTALLRYVDLGEKANAYPSQRSGGQKQRVSISRALASDPKVLLCDEATSALDPQTTASILKLLRRLNEETGITIVIITHQMQVVKDICQRVAVMEQGRVAEEGACTPSLPIRSRRSRAALCAAPTATPPWRNGCSGRRAAPRPPGRTGRSTGCAFWGRARPRPSSAGSPGTAAWM